MGLFKSKQEKDIEKRLLIKKTIANMNKYINQLEEQKKKYIESAKKAKQIGSETQYNLSVSGLKTAVAQQKRAQEMLLNFELTSQMKDLTAMTGSFLDGRDQPQKAKACCQQHTNTALCQAFSDGRTLVHTPTLPHIHPIVTQKNSHTPHIGAYGYIDNLLKISNLPQTGGSQRHCCECLQWPGRTAAQC